MDKFEFKKEDRYRVFKVRDIVDAIDFEPDKKDDILKALALLSNVTHNSRIRNDRKPFECVCVESDWGCYEDVWFLVEREEYKKYTKALNDEMSSGS